MFNNPYGSTSQQYKIMNYMVGLLNKAPAGSTIHIAMYSMNVDAVKEAIIRAKMRGVNVRFVTDDHGITTSQMREVISFLGQTVTDGPGSYIKICDYSCSSDFISLDLLTGDDIRPYNHAKYLTFSSVGGYSKVSLITSSNFTKTQASEGFNNLYSIRGDSPIYAFLLDRFQLMIRDDETLPAYQSLQSGKLKTYFFPANTGDILDKTTDPYYGILSNIRCTGLASGYGTYPSSPSKSRTIVYISMFQWSIARSYLARQVKALQDQGCSIRIVNSGLDWDPGIGQILTTTGKTGPIPIRNGDVDDEGDGNTEKFIHNKYILVNGKYLTDTSSKLVFTGTPNFTRAALRYNNEIALKIDSSSVYSSYKANFDLIYSTYTKPYRVPLPV